MRAYVGRVGFSRACRFSYSTFVQFGAHDLVPRRQLRALEQRRPVVRRRRGCRCEHGRYFVCVTQACGALPAPLLFCFFVPEFKVKYGFSAAADERQRAAAASLKSFVTRGRRRLWTSRAESIKPLQLSGTAKLARGQKAGDVIRAARCLRTRVVFDLYRSKLYIFTW